ncbi:MAG: helix-turn-helix domain-containing protein, partial [Sphaerochaetaceae bacterium]
KPFIDNQRLETAKLLLKFSDLTVSQISDQMGFENIYAFSNFFKRITFQNPTDFRKKYQNENYD